MHVRRMLLPVLVGIVFEGVTYAAPTAGVNTAPRPAPEPVRDPVCIGWDDGWAVHRYHANEAKWKTWKNSREALPFKAFQAVGPHAAAVIDPKKRYSGWLFDLHEEKWRHIPDSPIAGPTAFVGPVAVAFVGDELVVWGLSRGQTNGAVLDVASLTWRPAAAAPVPLRVRAAKAVIGKKLLVWGGFGPQGNGRFGPLSDGAVYDPRRDAWEKMPPTPFNVSPFQICSTTCRGRFVLFGGSTRQAASHAALLFDPAAGAWEVTPDCPFDLGQMSAAASSGSRIFFWSGKSALPENRSKTVLVPTGAMYDAGTKTWEALPEAPVPPRCLAYAQVTGERIFVWGGWDPRGNHPPHFFREAAAYDVDRAAWEKIADLPGEVPYALHPGW